MSISIEQFADFRANLYGSILYRADATMNLIDALAANTTASSVVQLSLSPLFPRQYSSIHDAVDNFFVVTEDSEDPEAEIHKQRLVRMRIIGEQCPDPVNRKFYLFMLDTTGQPRPFSPTLADRGFHYHPNPAPGNKPITIGHSYSTLAVHPEKEGANSPPWIIPLLIQRVSTDKKATAVGADQVADVMNDKNLPFGTHLSVIAGDTHYSACEFLGTTGEHENLVSVVRARSNRTFYNMPEAMDTAGKKGHPVWYGSPFKLQDSDTWPEPDAIEEFPYALKNGRQCQVTVQAWSNLLMRGKRDVPMHKHPFTLVRVMVLGEDGKPIFNRALWLIVSGKRRNEISLQDIYHSYRQRYDIEHFFRFGKNRLLMASYQSPEVRHEESWWEIAGLAYVNLYTAAHLAMALPYPWERWLPTFNKDTLQGLPTPSMVQRDLPRIIQQIGTPANPPKPRGKSPGRQKGDSPGKRKPVPVVKKGRKRNNRLAA